MRWSDASPKERHRPPHWIGEGCALFVTGATVDRCPHLLADARRQQLRDLIHAWAEEFQITVIAWVVLKEHYHAVLRLERDPESDLKRWVTAVHSDSSRLWNIEDQQVGRQVWYQYWDRTLWTEGDLWSRINYVHANPVKHGYVEVASDYPWSSLQELEAEWLLPEAHSAIVRFPAPRKLPNDDF